MGWLSRWEKYCTEKIEHIYLLCGIKKKGLSMMNRLDVRVICLHNSPSCVKGVDFLCDVLRGFDLDSFGK